MYDLPHDTYIYNLNYQPKHFGFIHKQQIAFALAKCSNPVN